MGYSDNGVSMVIQVRVSMGYSDKGVSMGYSDKGKYGLFIQIRVSVALE